MDNKWKYYKDFLEKETALIAYLDLANIFHWQEVLKWRFKVEDLISQIFSIKSIKEIYVYYGLDGKDLNNSQRFHNRIRKTGAILRAKPVKYINKGINEALLFKKSTMDLFNDGINGKISKLVEEIILIKEPKCNFDVEMTMDMLDNTEKVSGIILFSGDSDLKASLERLKIEGKKIFVVGVRGMTAKELHDIKDIYIDFGQFYQGKKSYTKSENPAFGGTA